MLKPKEVEIKDMDGNAHKYVISRLNAILGREIIAKYPLSSMPKLGDYEVNQETMLKLIGHTAKVLPDGQQIQLTTQALINNHVPDGETLLKLEYEMLSYNYSFLDKGSLSKLKSSLTKTLPDIAQKILTQSLRQSFGKK